MVGEDVGYEKPKSSQPMTNEPKLYVTRSREKKAATNIALALVLELHLACLVRRATHSIHSSSSTELA